MKVTFPKNIKKGLLAGFTLSIGPISLSIIQLFLVAIGIGLALAAFNGISKTGGKGLGIIFATFILGFFIFVAFFKVSEMNVIQLLAKKIRENFFDVTKKFQNNNEKFNSTEILLKEAKYSGEKKQVIEQKKEPEVEEIFENIKNNDLF